MQMNDRSFATREIGHLVSETWREPEPRWTYERSEDQPLAGKSSLFAGFVRGRFLVHRGQKNIYPGALKRSGKIQYCVP
jgi:hypothetical protein